MSCCGQKRQTWREAQARAARPAGVPAALRNPRTLYSLSGHALLEAGAVTGTTYLFGARGSTLDVDERDIAALLATGKVSLTKPSEG